MFDKLVNESIECINNLLVVKWDECDELLFKQHVLKILKILNKEKTTNVLKCGTRCLVMSIILLERVSKETKLDKNNINDYWNMSMIISFKLTEDDDFTDLFKKTFCITNSKLKELELNFCNLLNFKLFINSVTFNMKLISVLRPTK